MKADFSKLNPEEEFIFKWQYRLLGHFKTALIEAICRADDNNLAKLRLSFPDEVNGYIDYSQISGWWKKVQLKAGIEPD